MQVLVRSIDQVFRLVGCKSLNSQFVLSFIIILLLAITSGISLYLSLSINPQTINIAGRQRMLSQRIAKEAMLVQANLVQRSELDKSVKLFEDSHRNIINGHEELRMKPLTDPLIRAQLEKVWKLWEIYKEDVLDYAQSGDEEALAHIYDDSVVVLTEMNKAVVMLTKASSETMHQELVISFSFTVAIVILLLIGRIYGQKTVMLTLSRLEKHMADVGKGDFSHRFHIQHVDNELGTVFAGYNNMLESVGKVVSNVQRVAQTTERHVSDVSTAIQASQQGVQRQYEDIEQVASAMTEMAATVQAVAGNAEHAAQSALEADGQARSGGAVVKQSEEFAQDMLQRINATAEVLTELESETQAVDQVTSVINEIAEQTNLLALNAAIEAARAGEQGRGFAVVADEVRTLAQRTQESTHQIQALVERLQTKAETAVKSMVESTRLAKQSSELSEEAATSLNQIIGSTETISNMNNQISNSSIEQKDVAEDIDRRLVSISLIASGTRDDTAKVSQAADEIRREITELNNLVGQFRLLN